MDIATEEKPLLQEEAQNSRLNEQVLQSYQSLGQLFIQAREYHQLSISDTAQKLCLTEDKISAIESDNLQVFDAPIYARGYVDSYAKMVGIPKKLWEPLLSKLGYQVVPKYQANTVKPATVNRSIARLNTPVYHSKKSAKTQKHLTIAAIILAVVFVGVCWLMFTPSKSSSSGAQNIPITISQGSSNG